VVWEGAQGVVSCLSFVVVWLWLEEGIGLMTLGRTCVYGDKFEFTVEQRNDIARHLHRAVSPLLEKERSEETREKALKKVILASPFLLLMLKMFANGSGSGEVEERIGQRASCGILLFWEEGDQK